MTWAALVVLLMIVGLILLAIEFFAPGVSVPGIAGVGLIVIAGIIGWTKLGPMVGLASFGAGFAATIFGVWLLPKTGFGQRNILSTAVKARAGDASLAALVGKDGTSLTPLRPSGKVDIENQPVDVVTDGVYLEAGVRVRVSRVEGSRVQVDAVE